MDVSCKNRSPYTIHRVTITVNQNINQNQQMNVKNTLSRECQVNLGYQPTPSCLKNEVPINTDTNTITWLVSTPWNKHTSMWMKLHPMWHSPRCHITWQMDARGGHSPRFSNLRAAEKVKQVKHLKI